MDITAILICNEALTVGARVLQKKNPPLLAAAPTHTKPIDIMHVEMYVPTYSTPVVEDSLFRPT